MRYIGASAAIITTGFVLWSFTPAMAQNEGVPAGEEGSAVSEAPAVETPLVETQSSASSETQSSSVSETPSGGSNNTPLRSSSSSRRSSSSASARASSSSRASSAASSLAQSSSSLSAGGTVSSATASSLSSSSVSSSEESSSQSSEATIETQTSSGFLAAFLTPDFWERENIGYHHPMVDPPSRFSLDPVAIAGNLSLSLLFALIFVISTMILRRVPGHLQKEVLRRLPYQALLTIILIELIEFFIPTTYAQDFADSSGVSLMRVPIYGVLFFLVVGTSNAIFNSMLIANGGTLTNKVQRLPIIRTVRAVFTRKELQRALWFTLFLTLLYGVVGAHINPEFSLLPARQIGIILVAVVTIIFATYAADILRFVVAKMWRCPSWFEANVPGFLIALICVYLTREFNLSPGIIYGLPMALLMTLRPEKQEGFLEFVSMLWMVVLAFAVWAVIPQLGAFEIPLDSASLLFIILVEGALFELLPLSTLGGATIYRWKKPLWAVLFTATLFLFFHTLTNPQGTLASLQQSPPALFSVLCLGLYAIGVLLLWGWAVWRRKIIR